MIGPHYILSSGSGYRLRLLNYLHFPLLCMCCYCLQLCRLAAKVCALSCLLVTCALLSTPTPAGCSSELVLYFHLLLQISCSYWIVGFLMSILLWGFWPRDDCCCNLVTYNENELNKSQSACPPGPLQGWAVFTSSSQESSQLPPTIQTHACQVSWWFTLAVSLCASASSAYLSSCDRWDRLQPVWTG